MFKKLLTTTLIIAVTAIPNIALSSTLSVNKPRIVLDTKKSREQFRIYNPTNEFQTYRLSLINMEMDEEGNIKEVETFDSSAKDFLRVGPRMGKNVAPEQYQSFRVMLKRKGLQEEGEFRAHILMESLLPPAEDGEGIVVRPNIRYSVPVIVRNGNLTANIGIDELNASYTEDKKVNVSFAITRTGNRSIYGKVTARLSGNSEPIFTAEGLAVYTELNKRYFNFVTDVDLPKSGDIILAFEENPEYGGKELAERAFALEKLAIKPYVAPEAPVTEDGPATGDAE